MCERENCVGVEGNGSTADSSLSLSGMTLSEVLLYEESRLGTKMDRLLCARCGFRTRWGRKIPFEHTLLNEDFNGDLDLIGRLCFRRTRHRETRMKMTKPARVRNVQERRVSPAIGKIYMGNRP